MCSNHITEAESNPAMPNRKVTILYDFMPPGEGLAENHLAASPHYLDIKHLYSMKIVLIEFR